MNPHEWMADGPHSHGLTAIDPIGICLKLKMPQMNNLDEENGDKQLDFKGENGTPDVLKPHKIPTNCAINPSRRIAANWLAPGWTVKTVLF